MPNTHTDVPQSSDTSIKTYRLKDFVIRNSSMIMTKFGEVKAQLYDRVLSQKKDLDMLMCQSIVDQINVMYSKSGFKIGIIVFIVLLIGPILNIYSYIFALLIVIVLYILIVSRVLQYKDIPVTKKTLM
jgi:hypothetical protein